MECLRWFINKFMKPKPPVEKQEDDLESCEGGNGSNTSDCAPLISNEGKIGVSTPVPEDPPLLPPVITADTVVQMESFPKLSEEPRICEIEDLEDQIIQVDPKRELEIEDFQGLMLSQELMLDPLSSSPARSRGAKVQSFEEQYEQPSVLHTQKQTFKSPPVLEERLINLSASPKVAASPRDYRSFNPYAPEQQFAQVQMLHSQVDEYNARDEEVIQWGNERWEDVDSPFVFVPLPVSAKAEESKEEVKKDTEAAPVEEKKEEAAAAPAEVKEEPAAAPAEEKKEEAEAQAEPAKEETAAVVEEKAEVAETVEQVKAAPVVEAEPVVEVVPVVEAEPVVEAVPVVESAPVEVVAEPVAVEDVKAEVLAPAQEEKEETPAVAEPTQEKEEAPAAVEEEPAAAPAAAEPVEEPAKEEAAPVTEEASPAEAAAPEAPATETATEEKTEKVTEPAKPVAKDLVKELEEDMSAVVATGPTSDTVVVPSV